MSLSDGLRPERISPGDEGNRNAPLKETALTRENFVVIRETLCGGSAGNSGGRYWLEIDERCFWRSEATDRLGRLDRRLRGRLRHRDAPGVAGLTIVIIGAVPVERCVKAQQTHDEDERHGQQLLRGLLRHDQLSGTPNTILAVMPLDTKQSLQILHDRATSPGQTLDLQDVTFAGDDFVKNRVHEKTDAQTRNKSRHNHDGKGLLRIGADTG